MANLIYRNRCLLKEIRSSTKNFDLLNEEKLIKETENESQTLTLCGNGVHEHNEECDCGLEKYCNEWNCDASTCKRPIPIFIIVSIF